MNSLCRLRKVPVRSAIALSLATVGVLTSACDDDSPSRVSLVATASSLDAAAILAPTPIRLTPFAGSPCHDGLAFGTSVNLFITAGLERLTLDTVTLHMIDGTNVGGPSVMIPSSELATQFGSLFIDAGSTRAFALRPTFACTSITPRSLRGSAFVFDAQGRRQTIPLAGRIQ
jgi:hypothetical protein